MKKLVFILAIFALSGCYSLKGTSIPPEMKTIEVKFFENNAPLVVPTLSNDLTEALKLRVRTQTRLSLVQNKPDAVIEGSITDYDIKPIAIQSNAKPIAGANRLTITISVKYTVNLEKEKKQSFNQTFSSFTDFSLAGNSLQSQEQTLIRKITGQLTDDIFNRAFSQW